jgi:hypothetical protein
MPVEVSRIQEITTFGLNGQPISNIQISFKVDSHGPFTVIIPKEQFTQVRAAQEIDKIVREVNALVGK